MEASSTPAAQEPELQAISHLLSLNDPAKHKIYLNEHWELSEDHSLKKQKIGRTSVGRNVRINYWKKGEKQEKERDKDKEWEKQRESQKIGNGLKHIELNKINRFSGIKQNANQRSGAFNSDRSDDEYNFQQRSNRISKQINEDYLSSKYVKQTKLRPFNSNLTFYSTPTSTKSAFFTARSSSQATQPLLITTSTAYQYMANHNPEPTYGPSLRELLDLMKKQSNSDSKEPHQFWKGDKSLERLSKLVPYKEDESLLLGRMGRTQSVWVRRLKESVDRKKFRDSRMMQTGKMLKVIH